MSAGVENKTEETGEIEFKKIYMEKNVLTMPEMVMKIV